MSLLLITTPYLLPLPLVILHICFTSSPLLFFRTLSPNTSPSSISKTTIFNQCIKVITIRKENNGYTQTPWELRMRNEEVLCSKL